MKKNNTIVLNYYLSLEVSELWAMADELTEEICDMLMEDVEEEDGLAIIVKRRQLATVNRAIKIKETPIERDNRNRQIELPF